MTLHTNLLLQHFGFHSMWTTNRLKGCMKRQMQASYSKTHHCLFCCRFCFIANLIVKQSPNEACIHFLGVFYKMFYSCQFHRENRIWPIFSTCCKQILFLNSQKIKLFLSCLDYKSNHKLPLFVRNIYLYAYFI